MTDVIEVKVPDIGDFEDVDVIEVHVAFFRGGIVTVEAIVKEDVLNCLRNLVRG